MQPHYPHDIPWLGDSRSWGIFRGIPGIFATHCRLEEDESDEGSEMEAEAEDPLPDFRMVRRFGKSLYQSLSPQTNSWIIDVAWTCPLNLPSTGLSDWFFEFLRSRQEEQPSGRKRSPEPQISTAFDSTRDAAQHSKVELLVGAKAGQRCKEFDSKIETQQFQSQRRFSQRRCRLEIHRIEHANVLHFSGSKIVSPKSISFSWIKCNPPNRPISGLILYSWNYATSFSGSGLLPGHRPAGALPYIIGFPTEKWHNETNNLQHGWFKQQRWGWVYLNDSQSFA